MAKCVTCRNKLSSGDKYVTEPTSPKINTIPHIIKQGNFRFHHWDCIKKVPSLNQLKHDKEWVEL